MKIALGNNMFSNMKPLQLALRHTHGVRKRLINESGNSIPTHDYVADALQN